MATNTAMQGAYMPPYQHLQTTALPVEVCFTISVTLCVKNTITVTTTTSCRDLRVFSICLSGKWCTVTSWLIRQSFPVFVPTNQVVLTQHLDKSSNNHVHKSQWTLRLFSLFCTGSADVSLRLLLVSCSEIWILQIIEIILKKVIKEEVLFSY